MRTRSNDVSPIAGGRVASPTALDAGRTPTAPCGEAPTLMSSQAERRRPTSWRRGLPLREDKNGDPYWKNPGDEARFDRYLKLSAKCALGRAQFESPRYAAVKGERALVKLDAAEREVRVIVAAGEDIAKLGKDRLAELDAWAYGLAQKFAPVEDENGNTHWKNEGDELRFFRFMTFCGKCDAARAQFESPRYAAIAVANQEGQKIPDIYKQDPYKVMDDIIDRWFAAAAAERAEKALDITPTPELEPVAKPDPDDGIDG